MSDTIAAIATPTGNGGIGVLRLSGVNAQSIAEAILKSPIKTPRMAHLMPFFDPEGQMLDEGIVIQFVAPNSFTGEHVVELQGHGGAVVMNMLLKSAVHFGARLANPGEFSERAFLNDKIDLAQAEAISDLIESGSEMAARSALRSLQGDFSKIVHELVEQVIYIRMYVESAIDFPEEEIDFLSDGKVQALVEALLLKFEQVLEKAKQGKVLRDGMVVVLAGKPNAGKSSLLNAFSGDETAIVTDIPGTTRDVLKEYIHIDGMPVHIIDTAGIRKSDNVIEQEGIRRAIDAIKKSDRLLLLIDDKASEKELMDEVNEFKQYQVPMTILRNKADLSQGAIGCREDVLACPVFGLSAKQQQGIDELKKHLTTCMGFHANADGSFIARQRHIDALTKAQKYVAEGFEQLVQYQAGELLAADFQEAQHALSMITGEFTADDLLGEIFSRFCIGK